MPVSERAGEGDSTDLRVIRLGGMLADFVRRLGTSWKPRPTFDQWLEYELSMMLEGVWTFRMGTSWAILAKFGQNIVAMNKKGREQSDTDEKSSKSRKCYRKNGGYRRIHKVWM